MADRSAIEWTGGTWNVVTGCTKVSPGCAHCYIETTIPFRTKGRRFERVGNEETTGVLLHPERLDPNHALYPTKLADPIFVCSLSDLFHEQVPDDFLHRVFDVMEACQERTFQVLTKRPERMRDFIRSRYKSALDNSALRSCDPILHQDGRNIWLGVSIENARYTWRADVLREIPAAVRFLSCEPLLGSLFDVKTCKACGTFGGDVEGWDGDIPYGWKACPECRGRGAQGPLDLTGIDWVIVGGESGGKQARPMHPDWARELRDACLAEKLFRGGKGGPLQPWPAFFFKQWGSWAPGRGTHETALLRAGHPAQVMHYAGASPKSGGRELDGRTWDEFPQRQAVLA